MRFRAGLVASGMLLTASAAQARDVPVMPLQQPSPVAPARAPAPAPLTAPAEDRLPTRISLVDYIPVALPGGADVNIGLLDVPAASAREMNRRRTDPVREGRRARTGMAALGLSLRF